MEFSQSNMRSPEYGLLWDNFHAPHFQCEVLTFFVFSSQVDLNYEFPIQGAQYVFWWFSA